MKINYKGMTIYILKDYEAVSKKSAQMISSQITLKNDSVLGLATGSTPERTYELLIEMYKNDLISFDEIKTYNLDEYYNINPENEQSYHYYMNNHLFNHIDIRKENIHIPSGNVPANEINKYCQSYDDAIFDDGKIDLQILGIGTNGHIGFNEPDVQFEAGTHLVNLDEKTIKANARFFDKEEDVPKQAISIGIRNIMQSKKVILLATGESKQTAIEEMIFGAITPNLPASILQVHNDITILLDEKAGQKVLEKLK